MGWGYWSRLGRSSGLLSDWPILATALALQYPIWTEDMDFFGCGVATWTTDRVDLYLADAVPIPC
jgi:hypothetical protein